MKLTKSFFAIAMFIGITAYGQIFVANYRIGTIGEYTAAGTPVNTNLITALAGASGVAIDTNQQLYVANTGNGTNGSIRVYTTLGTPVNTNLIPGLNTPFGITLDGQGYIYVASYNNGTIGKYTTNGTIVSTSLVYGLSYPYGLALDGNGYLYVADNGNSRVGKYTTAGEAVNTSLITGLSPMGVAVNTNGILFVVNYSGEIWESTTSGTPINTNFRAIPEAEKFNGFLSDSEGISRLISKRDL